MILVVGLSPVWQRLLEFDAIRLGRVNRARRVLESAAGKGVNVGRIARVLGMKARLLTVAGGHRGELLKRALAADRIDAAIVTVSGETRVCQTLAVGGTVTELVEEVPPMTVREVAAVRELFTRDIRRARMLILMGSVPEGCGEDFYADLTRMAVRRGVPVLIDAQTKQLVNAVREKPYLVRLTADELADATGLSCRNERGIRVAARDLVGRCAQWVVVSQGPAPVLAVSRADSWSASPPRVKAVNPIGSGDAMMTGIAAMLLRGKPMEQALRFGVACGSANALTEAAGVVRRADVRRLLPRVRLCHD